MTNARLTQLMVATLRRHLAGDKVRVPEAGRQVWGWFRDMHATRTAGFGPNPIAYAEILAWAQLRRMPIGERHIAIIQALDNAFLEHAAAKTPGGPRIRRGSNQPISPAAFDAVFG